MVQWVGCMPQETILFAGTVKENIVYGNPAATDEQVIAAAEAAGVHHFIIDPPDGYGTEIGEAGQRQRISIARALVGDPAVLLLDGPSGSLGRQAEEELRATLINLAKEHSAILATHSPLMLQGCDNLAALDRAGQGYPAAPVRQRRQGSRQG
jgi:ATP-binding cassette subfamily C protein LapB